MITDYTGDSNDDNDDDANDGEIDKEDKEDDGVNENEKEDVDTIDNKDVDVCLPGELSCRVRHRSWGRETPLRNIRRSVRFQRFSTLRMVW